MVNYQIWAKVRARSVFIPVFKSIEISLNENFDFWQNIMAEFGSLRRPQLEVKIKLI